MRQLLIAGFLILGAAVAFGQTRATVESVSGSVEFRPPGGSWQAVQEGQQINRGTTLSTGFNSRARLRLANSVVDVAPLTRMTLEELVETSDTVSTDLFVRVGRVRANVQTTEGIQNEFRLRSSTATASVRGTDFSFDTKRTRVNEGVVTVANFVGRSTSVPQGASAVIQQFGSIQDVRETFLSDAAVETVPGEEGQDSDTITNKSQAGNAIVVVTIDFQ
jgi:hypothetical protein